MRSQRLPPLRVVAALAAAVSLSAVPAPSQQPAPSAASPLALAARLPHLRDPNGPTVGDVIDVVVEALAGAGIEAAARARRLEVHAARPGVDRLDVEVGVAADDLAEAERMLRELAAATPAATTAQEEAPPALRFAGLRLLRISIGVAGGDIEPPVVWASNPEAPRATAGRRPAGGNKDGLDLLNLYGNGGYFSDTDGNLIPDRVEGQAVEGIRIGEGKPRGSHWSQAKATTRKPTVIYSARQHANEVSSTSHVLKLAELLLTDPAYDDALDKVNVVIHPITNPDGAQLAYDLHQITPDHMLHAGYLGSLGVDVTSGQGSPDAFDGGASFKVHRPRPPEPPEEADAGTAGRAPQGSRR